MRGVIVPRFKRVVPSVSLVNSGLCKHMLLSYGKMEVKMALRNSTLLPSTITKTLICIDELKDFEFAGRLFNPFMPEVIVIRGIKDFIDIMDGFFDGIGYPQAYYSDRCFDDKKALAPDGNKKRTQYAEVVRHYTDRDFDAYKGSIVTFVIQVQFRQNATWQGLVEWQERGIKCGFRSILELIKLMDEAVQKSTVHELSHSWEEL